MNSDVIEEIKRLKFEDLIWVLFAILAISNILGDRNEIEYLETNTSAFHERSNKIFEVTLTITLLIYIYFLVRNFNAYKKASEDQKNLYFIKLLGSSFLIAGIILLIYFQFNQTNFTGSPAI